MREELNQNDREELERILSRDPQTLTSTQVAYLRARRDYLTKEERRVFADVLEGNEATTEEREDDVPSMDWTREQLNEYANGLGIENPEEMDNKQAVLDAIETAGE